MVFCCVFFCLCVHVYISYICIRKNNVHHFISYTLLWIYSHTHLHVFHPSLPWWHQFYRSLHRCVMLCVREWIWWLCIVFRHFNEYLVVYALCCLIIFCRLFMRLMFCCMRYSVWYKQHLQRPNNHSSHLFICSKNNYIYYRPNLYDLREN